MATTSRERLTRALCLEEPRDRVPFGEWEIQGRPLAKVLGRTPVLYNHRPIVDLLAAGKRDKLVERQAEDAIDLAKKLKIDIFYLPFVPSENWDPQTVKQVGKNRWVLKGKFPNVFVTFLYAPVDSTYAVCEYNPDSDSFWEVESNLNSVEALKEYTKALEQDRDISVDQSTLDLIGRVVKEIGDTTFICAAADGTSPFLGSPTWMPIFLKCQYTHPDLVRRLLKEHTRRYVEYGKAAIDAGVSGILMNADYCHKHGPFMSPKQFRELYLPEVKAHHDAFHRKGAFVIQHKDGNVWPIADDLLLESKTDAFQAMEPTAGMKLEEMKEKYGDKICLMGNIDCVYTLVHKTAEDVAAETKQCIKTGAPGGGYIVSSSNVVIHHTPPENYLALVETVKKYGKYPLRA